MGKDGWKGLFRPENKKMRSNVLLALLLGVLLLAAGRAFSGGDAASPPQQERQQEVTAAERQTEQRMAEILSKIEGAGQVDVMLTWRQTAEKTIAHNETREENGDALRTEQTAILLEDETGSTMPVVLTEAGPVVEGVVIVAQGGGDPVVSAALNQAAQALLDVPAHKVAVLKMK